MLHIDYYFATISPFTYLAGDRFEQLLKDHGATARYKPIDIIALFARTGGKPPKDRHPARQEYRAQELLRVSQALDMPFNLKPAHWPTNPAPSSYALISAQNEGGGDLGALVHAFTRAVWADEKDIAQEDVIKSCLIEAGFDPALSDKGMLRSAEIYEKNLEDAVQAGVFGAPFYIVTDTDQRFWGQDRLDALDRHLANLATA